MNNARSMKHLVSTLIAVAAVVPLVLNGRLARACDQRPALTSRQIEDDWLLQTRIRFRDVQRVAMPVTAEEDAAGGCDGVINGKWGFHTAMEDAPWWQVDLGQLCPLDRIVLFNRCDGFEARASKIRVLLSADGQQFDTAYTHNGQVFRGQPDNKPLVVELHGKRARFVRLQLPGHSYFHLDEVQVFSNRGATNIALGKSATQSSVSQWSRKQDSTSNGVNWPLILRMTIDRGRRLARQLHAMDVDAEEPMGQLEAVERQFTTASAPANDATWQELYFHARRIIRKLAFSNPLLDFDRILFVKRAPSMFPHLSDQYYGWWARPGGGICMLEGFTSAEPSVRCLTESWPEGNFLRPDLSYDGTKVLFAFSRYHADVADVKNKRDKDNVPEDVFCHLFEMDLRTGHHRQLTHGKYDDFDGRYLPNDEIIFLSTRKGQFLQTTRRNTQQTLCEDLPDSYVRCGGNDYRPVPVFTLHKMDGNGRAIWPISAFETFEYTPSVAGDGRILYCRWDYIDRFNGHFFSLWSTNPDGTNAQLVYGNVTKAPQATMEPRSIPGSNKILFTGAAHHSVTGGTLVLLDPAKGNEGGEPITRLTPEVPFPEVEKNAGMYYASPYPLSEDFYLVSWSNHRLPPHGRYEGDRNPANAQGLYLYDRFGNLELLYRDPAISSATPLPCKPRRRPPVLADRGNTAGRQTGSVVLQDIYRGLEGIDRGRVKRLRIVGIVPKLQPRMNMPSLGVSREETGKFVLGSVPVESDGSAYLQIPSGVPIFFQALDEQGYALQTMRSLTYVQPGETLACIGCHEPRQATPAVRMPLALARGPSPIQLGPIGSWPLRFSTLVQPVLDAHCTECHGSNGKGKTAGTFDLRPNRAWQTLIDYAGKDLYKLVFERDVSVPGQSPARQSKVLEFLRTDPKHQEIALSDDDMRRLITWMDTYGQTQGSFSHAQEKQLETLRVQLEELGMIRFEN